MDMAAHQRFEEEMQRKVETEGGDGDGDGDGGPPASDAEVEAAARQANAHNFISEFPDGYDTLVGERGVRCVGFGPAFLLLYRYVYEYD